MNRPRDVPDEPAGPFEAPPDGFVDGVDRQIAIHRFGTHLDDPAAERDTLTAMYDSFDPADRAQGIPPSNSSAVRDWLDTLFVDDAIHVLAWHDDTVAGHALLVPDDDGGYELAIFVHQDYQGVGIGTHLLRALLGAGARAGVERVWLTVERWNRAAVALYEGVGFETTNAGSFDLEMALRLGPAGAEEPGAAAEERETSDP